MEIAIIGGGISGLYCANRLEALGNKVTIFENNRWGGDIQSEIINGNCYPISTLFVQPNDNVLIKHFNDTQTELKTHYVYMKNYMDMNYIIGISVILLVVGWCQTNKKQYFGLLIILILIIMTLLLYPIDHIKDANFLQKYALNRIQFPILRGFGTVKSLQQFNDLDLNFRDISITVTSIYKSIINGFRIPTKCGFEQLCKKLTGNVNIVYKLTNITEIYRMRNKISIVYDDGGYKQKFFNKLIVTCPYDSYKNILPLSNFEKTHLSDNIVYDFYTTIIQLHKNNKSFKTNDSILGYVRLDDNTYLCGSHSPLNKQTMDNDNHIIFYKHYKWKMGYLFSRQVRNIIETRINGHNNIYYIGKATGQMGVQQCINYVDTIIDKILKEK
jgi:hypothetical protein